MKVSRYVTGRRVVINLKSGSAVQGVIVKETRTWSAVKSAEVSEPGASAATPVDGEIIIFHVDIDFVQVP